MYDDPNYPKLVILSRVISQRLREEIRDKRGLTYVVGSAIRNEVNTSTFMIATPTSVEQTAQALEVTEQVLNKIKENGITESQFSKARTAIMNEYVLGFTNTLSVASNLLFLKKIGKNSNYINDRNKLYLSMELDDVNEFAKDFIQPQLRSIVSIGKVHLPTTNLASKKS